MRCYEIQVSVPMTPVQLNGIATSLHAYHRRGAFEAAGTRDFWGEHNPLGLPHAVARVRHCEALAAHWGAVERVTADWLLAAPNRITAA